MNPAQKRRWNGQQRRIELGTWERGSKEGSREGIRCVGKRAGREQTLEIGGGTSGTSWRLIRNGEAPGSLWGDPDSDSTLSSLGYGDLGGRFCGQLGLPVERGRGASTHP